MFERGAGVARNAGDVSFVRCTSRAMLALERIVTDIASTDIPVLLVGEGGTGKEIMALQIHRLSARRNQPLVKLSCPSMRTESFPAWLSSAESHSRSSSGASVGTVFLDEISELDPACQRNLVCLLPDGDAVPRPHCLRARVISATTRNLEEEVKAGRFRSELYYRINDVCLRLPPLRQRKEDIPPLVEFFLTKYVGLFGRSRPSLSAETLNCFMEYSWPGNIRELENTVKKIVALGDEQVVVNEIAAAPKLQPVNTETRGLSLKAAARVASRQAERELILKTLAHTHWNRKRAAQELQISYKALLYKLKQIESEDPSTA